MTVRVEGLTKRFASGGRPAVANVSFEALAGGITSVIGPSGAGKSTVLRVVAGLEQPDAGTVFIGGADATKHPARERGIGLVFQNYALFNNMSVRENVGFGLEVRKRSKSEIRERVDQLLELVQLKDLGNRHPSQLSGGQRQRVAFARALAIEPKVLLLDEPFGALDARVRRELGEWLRELHERTKLSTMLVTHDQEEALELSEHVVIMLDGAVAQAGSPKDVYDSPRSPEVASFLGANVVRGKVRDGRAEAGSMVLSAPDGASEGAGVHAYVRPEDVKLTRPDAPAGDAVVFSGKIERARVVGPRVKIALQLSSGDRVTVEVARAEFEALGLGPGEHVHVDMRSARVFLDDFAI